MADRPIPLHGEGQGLETFCSNVPARTSLNGRSIPVTHSNGLRRATSCSFPQAVIIKQPSFWITNHEMNTSKEVPYVRMFLFRGGSRGLDSPAPDDPRKEPGIRPCSVEYHEAMRLETMRCKVDMNKEVFASKVPRQSFGFRETKVRRRHFTDRLHDPTRRFGSLAQWAFRSHQLTGLT